MRFRFNFNSVRFKLTLWYVIAVTVTLSAFSFIVYENMKRELYDNLDKLLSYRAEGVADAIDAYLETEELETGSLPKGRDKTETFDKIIQPLLREEFKDPKLAAIGVRIIDPAGNILSATPDTEGAPAIPERSFADALKGDAAYETIRISDPDGVETAFKSYATPVNQGDRVQYIVQTYRSLYHAQFALQNLRSLMTLLIPFMALLTGAIGMMFARIALKPVSGMIGTIRQITAENLQLRILPPGTKDEIRELADIFNDMLARLEDSFQSQRRFIQDVSHELKTPLTIIKGELEVALKRARSAQEYASILQSNLEETDKISRIVENLLILARFDSRELRLERTSVALGPLLEGLAADLSSVAAAKRVSLVIPPYSGDLEVGADREQLRRALLNIADNAVKYAGEGGRVSLEARKENGETAVRIADDGPGIPAADLPHIFKRFYRSDASRTSAGFGLGLAIAKSIIDAHGARITVESSAAAGSVFTVYFPSSSQSE